MGIQKSQKREEKKIKGKQIRNFFIGLGLVFLAITTLIILLKNIQKETTDYNLDLDNIKPKKNYVIPKMYFSGNIEDMQEKTDKRQIQVKYESSNLNFESFAQIKVQGSYTLKFDKKNYNITFFEDSSYTKKKKINVKWGDYSKYTLKANWTEPLQCRNTVTAQIASEINQKYGILTDSVNNGLIDGFPIEIYVNKEFLGLYTMNIHKDYIFNLDNNNKNNIAIFANTPEPVSFDTLETEDWENYEVEFGEQNSETLAKLNRLIDFIKNSSDEQFVNDFDKYLNKDSVLNYYCLMYFAHLIDNVTRNIFLVTYDGEIWYIVPYDFDQSWGNEFKDRSEIKDDANRHTAYYTQISPLWSRVKKLLRTELDNRYIELRKDILTKENVVKKMYDFYTLIPNETWQREYNKWNNKTDYNKSYINEYLEQELLYLDRIYGHKDSKKK